MVTGGIHWLTQVDHLAVIGLAAAFAVLAISFAYGALRRRQQRQTP